MFHGWEDSKAKTNEVRTDTIGYSFDSNPHISKIPSHSSKFIIASFSKDGMPIIWLATKGLAEIITSSKRLSFKDVGIPRLFEISQAQIDLARTSNKEDSDIVGSGKAFMNAKCPQRMRLIMTMTEQRPHTLLRYTSSSVGMFACSCREKKNNLGRKTRQ